MKESSDEFDVDVAVVGGGSAGFAAARVAVDAGLETVVIEGGSEVGGLCILRGCMPSKALLYAGEVLHQVRRAGIWGLAVPDAGVDFAAVMARKERMIGDFANYRRQQLESADFKFIRANARFVDSHTLELAPLETGSDPRRLRARHFVIATGSRVAPPPLPQLAAAGYITSDDALSLKRLPKSLIVLGGGAVACELAQWFARFDVKVTMIQRSPRILRAFDEDAAIVLDAVLRREGIELFTDTKLRDISGGVAGKSVTFTHDGRQIRVEAEEILHCLGRVPNTAGLGLEEIGVKLDDGRIVANDRMQTSVPHIFTAGDCTGPHEIVHIAVQQGEVAARNIARPDDGKTMDDRLLMSVIFTEPQLAFVGLTEAEASAREIPVEVASYAFGDHGKALIMEALDGFVKLLADPETGEIIGGACVGQLGGELIHEICAAMYKRMTVRELAEMPHYHPTLAEIWTYPAEELADRISVRG